MQALSYLSREPAPNPNVNLRDMTQQLIQKENEIKRSEKIIRAVMEASPIGIALIENRRITWMNVTASRIFGYENINMEGMCTKELYKDKNEYDRIGTIIYDQHKKGHKTGEFSTIGIKRTGEEIPLYVRTSFLNGESDSVICAFFDAREMKRICDTL